MIINIIFIFPIEQVVEEYSILLLLVVVQYFQFFDLILLV